MATWDPKRKKWETEYLSIQRDPEYMESVEREIAEMGIHAAGSRVLDIGCGPGIHIHHILKQNPADGVGLDVSPFYMASVRQLEPRAAFCQGSAEKLPFSDASFDLVLLLGTLLHVNAEITLAEVKRILRPGGALWVSHMLPGYYWWKIRYRSRRPLRTYAIETLSSIKRLLEPRLHLSDRSTYATHAEFLRLLAPLKVEKKKIIYGKRIPCQQVVVARKPV